MPLLPRADHPITPGKIGLPFDVMNPQSVHNQLLRCMRQSRGFSAYELTIAGSEAKASVLSSFAGLSKDDAADEGKLSAALDGLLLSLIEAIDEAASHYEDRDQPILKVIAARTLKDILAGAISVAMEDADAELSELRKTDTSPCLKESNAA